MYHGDIRLGDTIDIKFTTRQISGAPSTLSSSPVISAYPANSLTEITAGITLTVDFDSRTGLNNVRVVATSGNGYATATNYTLVITTGTVNSVSVVGECIGSFSIEARSALMPTTAALTLDVSAGGEAGLDWGNIGSKTTVNALTNTSIITTQKVDVDTIKTNPVVNAGTITFPTTATLASTTNITAGTVTTATNVTTVNGLAANVITAAATAADFGTEVAAAVWQDAVAGDFTVASSIGKALYTGNVVPGGAGGMFIAGTNAATTVNITGNITGNLSGSVGSVTGAVGSVTGAVASVTAGVALTSGERNSVADAILDRDMSTGTDSGSATVRTPRQALRALRNKLSITGVAMTVTKEDDATASWTATLTTDAAALPITAVDPAGP